MLSLHFLFKPGIPEQLLNCFQKGVQVEATVGQSVLSLLRDDFCMTQDGIEKIQTIFYFGKPVDDLAGCLIEDHGVLALSAALPGLVGACLRRGGAWSALRDSISHPSMDDEAAIRQGTITIKLFNFMLKEVGPLLLSRGIYLEPDVVASLNQSEQFWNTVRVAMHDNDSIDQTALTDLLHQIETVKVVGQIES